jgi:hypothetical protein
VGAATRTIGDERLRRLRAVTRPSRPGPAFQEVATPRDKGAAGRWRGFPVQFELVATVEDGHALVAAAAGRHRGRYHHASSPDEAAAVATVFELKAERICRQSLISGAESELRF